jgi:hypothetical protein
MLTIQYKGGDTSSNLATELKLVSRRKLYVEIHPEFEDDDLSFSH